MELLSQVRRELDGELRQEDGCKQQKCEKKDLFRISQERRTIPSDISVEEIKKDQHEGRETGIGVEPASRSFKDGGHEDCDEDGDADSGEPGRARNTVALTLLFAAGVLRHVPAQELHARFIFAVHLSPRSARKP